MSRRTTARASHEQTPATDVLHVPATEVPATEVLAGPLGTPRTGRRLTPGGLRRPALYVAVAAAGAIMVNVLTVGPDDALADAPAEPVSIAAQLGLSSQQAGLTVAPGQVRERLGALAGNRSQREAEQAAAAQVQAAADQAVLDAEAEQVRLADEMRLAEAARLAEEARLAAEAEAAAAEASAAAEAVEEEEAAAEAAAAAKATKKSASAAAPAATTSAPEVTAEAPASTSSGRSGSFQDYALAQLGGDSREFTCLESLWGKESGWNPTAQNSGSTAYGIPQFLDSTWKGTGIAKTSDGYRQIDAGLIYIDSRYGSPCGAWSHSKSTGWY